MLASLVGGMPASLTVSQSHPWRLWEKRGAGLRETRLLSICVYPTWRGTWAQSTAALVNSPAGDKPHFPDEKTDGGSRGKELGPRNRLARRLGRAGIAPLVLHKPMLLAHLPFPHC